MKPVSAALLIPQTAPSVAACFFSVLVTVAFVYTSQVNARADQWLAVTENFPPYNYTDAGEPAGYSTDLVKRLSIESGVNFKIEVLPWSRAMFLASSEPNVLIFSMLRTPDREDKYHWIGSIDDLSLYTWGLKSFERKNTKPNSQLTYAVSRSLDELNINMLVDKFDAQAHKIIAVETTEQLIGMLLKQRVDRVLLAENIWRKLKTALPEDTVHNMQRLNLVAQRELYVASSLQSEQRVILKLQQAFQKISAHSSIIALRQSHGIH